MVLGNRKEITNMKITETLNSTFIRFLIESSDFEKLKKNKIPLTDKERELEAQVGKDFTHKVIIEGDEKIPYQLLFKVMYTCSQSEYYKMRLLTIKK